MLDGRNLRYVGQHEHRTNCAIEWARNGVCLWFWGIGGWIGWGGSDQGGQATEAEEEGRGQHRDDGICDGTFLLAVRYIGSVVDDVDGGGKKVTGDISWGKYRRGEGEQNDNNKNNQNMLVDDETICRYFSKYLIMRATCHHPG